MAKKTGVDVKKIKLLDRNVKADFKKIFTVLSKSAIMFHAGTPISVFNGFKELISIIDAFKFSKDASVLAYQLILTALINASHTLAEENSTQFIAELEDAKNLYDNKDYVKFLDGISPILEDQEMVLEFEHLHNPRSIPLLQDFQEYFRNYLILFGILGTEAKLISNRLPTYFVFELNDEWQKNYSKYEHLLNTLDTPVSEAARRERQWEAYNTYLEREVAKPVFNESFSLNDIFIPLRAYYKIKGKKHGGTGNIEKVAVHLQEAMDNWLDSVDEKDTIKIIQGGPGSGKSSFVKWWVAKIAKSRSNPVLFFPLHHFDIESNIKTAVGRHFNEFDHIPIEFNPLEETKSINKMLLVFDGLDELAMKDKSSKESANAFIQELKDFLAKKNEDGARFKILVTGRPISIQNAENKLRDSNEQVLNLLPYYLEDAEQKQYSDKKGILKKDHRNEWWNRFFAFKGIAGNNLPVELLSTTNMDKITTEPLLNYLVALSWKDAPEKFNKDTNINDVYHQLILSVYTRDWDSKGKHRGLEDLSSDDFLHILEEIAICAWQAGDARVTTERKIEKHLKGKGLENLLEEYKASAKSGVSRLLTAFYFRKSGKEESEDKDDTFEFTHKSFGEYLAARAIVELIAATDKERKKNKEKAKSSRDINKGWTIQQCLGEWLRMTGKNVIDNYLNQYIINEIKIRKEKGASIENWQVTLCEVINELIFTGISFNEQEQSYGHLEEVNLARNTEEAILISLSNCAYITEKNSEINWGNDTQASIWLNRLSTSLNNSNFVFKKLNHLNLSEANLSGANLRETDLSEANLSEANLSEANLRGADLSGADLSEANLSEGNLSEADLFGANLSGANLSEANLRGTDLMKTDFNEAYMSEADLSGVNLKGAYIRGANLSGADLRGAYLRGANLRGANLRGAYLRGAYLRGTDLRGTDLKEATLRGADLSEADLSGADLSEANLSGVDLSGANLSGVDLLNFNQLASTKSLVKTTGIPTIILDQLQKEKSNLFE